MSLFLRIYYNPKGDYASLDEVKAAIPPDMPELAVDRDTASACVNLPTNGTYEDWKRLAEHFEAAGFETDYNGV